MLDEVRNEAFTVVHLGVLEHEPRVAFVIFAKVELAPGSGAA